MKAATRKPTVESTVNSSTMETIHCSIVETIHCSAVEATDRSAMETIGCPAMKTAMAVKTVPVRYEAITMESVVESVMHVKIVVHKTAVREETSMREKAATKPAREWVEKCRRDKSTIIWVIRVVGIWITPAIIPACIRHRRT